mgnify:CR=1 FL=1
MLHSNAPVATSTSSPYHHHHRNNKDCGEEFVNLERIAFETVC